MTAAERREPQGPGGRPGPMAVKKQGLQNPNAAEQQRSYKERVAEEQGTQNPKATEQRRPKRARVAEEQGPQRAGSAEQRGLQK